MADCWDRRVSTSSVPAWHRPDTYSHKKNGESDSHRRPCRRWRHSRIPWKYAVYMRIATRGTQPQFASSKIAGLNLMHSWRSIPSSPILRTRRLRMFTAMFVHEAPARPPRAGLVMTAILSVVRFFGRSAVAAVAAVARCACRNRAPLFGAAGAGAPIGEMPVPAVALPGIASLERQARRLGRQKALSLVSLRGFAHRARPDDGDCVPTVAALPLRLRPRGILFLGSCVEQHAQPHPDVMDTPTLAQGHLALRPVSHNFAQGFQFCRFDHNPGRL